MDSFKAWLNEGDFYQKRFPFAMEEDPPDNRIKRFKSLSNYIKAVQKHGTNTSKAAEQWVVTGGYSKERVEETVDKAVEIPEFKFPGGRVRPPRYLAFVHLVSEKPITDDPSKKLEYMKHRHRYLLFYQGDGSQKYVYNTLDRPVAGIVTMGDGMIDVWVDPEYRGQSKVGIPNLFKELMSFVKRRGVTELAPYDATCPECGTTVRVKDRPMPCPNCGALARPLTSKDFLAAKAKYDWKRAGRG